MTLCIRSGANLEGWRTARTASSGTPTTNPLDRDTDDDGLSDYEEEHGSWCYLDWGQSWCEPDDHSDRITNATLRDTDGDGVPDGLEVGIQSAGVGTDPDVFRGDLNPSIHTDPTKADTDGDNLTDGQEDGNHDGQWDWNTGETDPSRFDSDADGLPDGRVWYGAGSAPNDGGASVYWKGEDKNLNGVRDVDADENWTETDPLANDSDVDGVLDGWEVNGSWCYSTESACMAGAATNASRALKPLNPDSDGDGLRDGQETAGWKVGVWRETTMESLRNYTVVSDPNITDSDGDQLNDSGEFQHGSDPWVNDTDGDFMNDSYEASNSMNVTGYYLQPPQILNWSLTKQDGGGDLPLIGHKVLAVVDFDLNSSWGLDICVVDYGQPTFNNTTRWELENLTPAYNAGNASARARVLEILDWTEFVGDAEGYYFAGNKTHHVHKEFTMNASSDLVTGVWVRARVLDVYGVPIAKTQHLTSALEAVLNVVASAIHVLAEAASAAVNWILDLIEGVVGAALTPISRLFNDWGAKLAAYLSEGARSAFADSYQGFFEGFFALAAGPFGPVVSLFLIVFNAVAAPLEPFMRWAEGLLNTAIYLVLSVVRSILGGQDARWIDLPSGHSSATFEAFVRQQYDEETPHSESRSGEYDFLPLYLDTILTFMALTLERSLDDIFAGLVVSVLITAAVLALDWRAGDPAVAVAAIVLAWTNVFLGTANLVEGWTKGPEMGVIVSILYVVIWAELWQTLETHLQYAPHPDASIDPREFDPSCAESWAC